VREWDKLIKIVEHRDLHLSTRESVDVHTWPSSAKEEEENKEMWIVNALSHYLTLLFPQVARICKLVSAPSFSFTLSTSLRPLDSKMTHMIFFTIRVEDLPDEFDLGWEERVVFWEGQDCWQICSFVCCSGRAVMKEKNQEVSVFMGDFPP
jgi:hypothetical protein